MLVESFVASTRRSEKPSVNSPHKDAGVFFHEYQPQTVVRSTFKKSSTPKHGLAISSTHVFAAQTDKSVVNVYNIEKGSQEALFPFKERITSLALVGDDASTLVLGNAAGRLILCELLTGRQVSTPSAHLQAVECVVVDSTNNFLLTGSPDSNVHVWSIPKILSFSSASEFIDTSQPSPYAPVHTLSNHRGPVNAIVTGHSHTSANIAVTAAGDNTCLVWNYQAGSLLHTFLLSSTPLCIALDPADRALYIGHEDGSIQFIDFFQKSTLENPLHDSENAATATQPQGKNRWPAVLEPSPILSLGVSYDGTSLLSGHEDGKVQQWDVGARQSRGTIIGELHASVTNIVMQRPTGFANSIPKSSKPLMVVKPILSDSVNTGSSDVPEDYVFKAQFSSQLIVPRFSSIDGHGTSSQTDDLMDDFEEALAHDTFPQDLIDRCTAALSAPLESDGDVAALKGWGGDLRRDVLQAQEQATQARKETFKYIELANDFSKEMLRLQDAERARKRDRKMRRVRRERYEEARRKKAMGEAVDEGDQEMLDQGAEESSSSDEMSDA